MNFVKRFEPRAGGGEASATVERQAPAYRIVDETPEAVRHPLTPLGADLARRHEFARKRLAQHTNPCSSANAVIGNLQSQQFVPDNGQ